ncbi:MAG: hypothetical protein GF331_14800 [Chitinivibrionales bacterium]|nr:hypothetical protein [Chitinivibrionales bacterium]
MGSVCPKQCSLLVGRAAVAGLALALIMSPVDAQTTDSTAADSALAARMCLSRQGYREAVLYRTDREVLTVRARIDSFDVKLLVDRRSPMTFLDRSALVKLGYEPEPAHTEINFGGTIEPLYTLTPAQITIGGLMLDSMTMQVTRLEHIARASGIADDMTLAGVLGADFLRKCGAMLDIANDRLFLRRPAPEPVVADTTADTAKGILETIGEKLRKREAKHNRR